MNDEFAFCCFGFSCDEVETRDDYPEGGNKKGDNYGNDGWRQCVGITPAKNQMNNGCCKNAEAVDDQAQCETFFEFVVHG